jgi:hypothetical protein
MPLSGSAPTATIRIVSPQEHVLGRPQRAGRNPALVLLVLVQPVLVVPVEVGEADLVVAAAGRMVAQAASVPTTGHRRSRIG